MMGNLPLLWAIPYGLWQLHKQRRFVRALYRMAAAGRDAAEGMRVLSEAAAAVTAQVRAEQGA